MNKKELWGRAEIGAVMLCLFGASLNLLLFLEGVRGKVFSFQVVVRNFSVEFDTLYGIWEGFKQYFFDHLTFYPFVGKPIPVH